MKKLSFLWLVVVLAFPAAAATKFTPDDSGKIALITGQLLSQVHYRQSRFDDTVSEMFLHKYLDAFDPNHLFFLQSDIDDYEKRFGHDLDNRTFAADASPAFEIFQRFTNRLSQCHQRVQKLLKENFDFTKDESFPTTRNKSPWPKDEAEADELWRLRIKLELLQGRLNKDKPEDTIKVISKRYDRLVKAMGK